MKITSSNIPVSCKDGQPVILGIDEAGRGPVLGPLVYGAAYWALSHDEELQSSQFDDSKALTAIKRTSLFEQLKAHESIGYVIVEIPADELSSKMLRRIPYNLNAISHDTAILLVRQALKLGVNVQEVYVDTVGDPGRYQDKLNKEFDHKIKFTVAKKADSLYKVVSAASICAKVIRDHVMETWDESHETNKKEDTDQQCIPYGSGYPSDPTTKAWLSASVDPIFGFSSIVRFSWSTSDVILEQNAHPCTWPDDDEQKEQNAPKITGFFPESGNSQTKQTVQSKWLKRRKIQRLTVL